MKICNNFLKVHGTNVQDISADSETIIAIQIFGEKKYRVNQIFARLYFMNDKADASDAFMHFVADDIKNLVEGYTKIILKEKFLAHIELFETNNIDIIDLYSLGDYALV